MSMGNNAVNTRSRNCGYLSLPLSTPGPRIPSCYEVYLHPVKSALAAWFYPKVSNNSNGTVIVYYSSHLLDRRFHSGFTKYVSNTLSVCPLDVTLDKHSQCVGFTGFQRSGIMSSIHASFRTGYRKSNFQQDESADKGTSRIS
jgi:hypothetical protein